MKKTGEEVVSKENVSVLVNTNTRNRKGEVVGSQEQYVPGERITYRVNKVCKKCGKSVEKVVTALTERTYLRYKGVKLWQWKNMGILWRMLSKFKI